MAKQTLQELDAGQLDLMWNFLRISKKKPDKQTVQNLINHIDVIRKAMMQKNAGQEKYSKKDAVDIADIGTYINFVVLDVMALRVDGVLDMLLETISKQEEDLQ